MNYKVVEKFVSLNGEGECAGQLAVFVRFLGCNLRCAYCDTMWANVPDAPYTEMTGEEIYQYIQGTGVRNVTLTGGEPLLRDGMAALLALLAQDGKLRVEIETNGSVDLAPFAGIGPYRPVFTMDYKLPSSGMETQMRTENFQHLAPCDTVKFVVETREDLERARAVVQSHGLTERCGVHFSPVFGKTDLDGLVEFMKEHEMNGVTLRVQLHKIIWHPEARGV